MSAFWLPSVTSGCGETLSCKTEPSVTPLTLDGTLVPSYGTSSGEIPRLSMTLAASELTF